MTQPFHLWLAALRWPAPEAEMRTYWNSKDDPTPLLDAALKEGAYFYLGTWGEEHESDSPQSARCPALRVSDWLFWRGTTDHYRLPMLDEQLLTELITCFQPRPGDLPAVATDLPAFCAFLKRHEGAGVLTLDREAVPHHHMLETASFMEIADSEILAGTIIRGIKALREHLGCSLHEALLVYVARYKRLRRERPGDFAKSDDEYWANFYS